VVPRYTRFARVAFDGGIKLVKIFQVFYPATQALKLSVDLADRNLLLAAFPCFPFLIIGVLPVFNSIHKDTGALQLKEYPVRTYSQSELMFSRGQLLDVPRDTVLQGFKAMADILSNGLG